LKRPTIIRKLQTLVGNRTIRFVIVGILNTLVNFVILDFSFYELKLNKVVSNIVATCVAIVLSFVLNRNFVFVHRGKWFKQFVLFASVTIVGTLVINNAIYILSLAALGHYADSIARTLSDLGPKIGSSFVLINGSAAIATLFSMVWNYNGYKRIVFRTVTKEEAHEES
jgi:putative flippase GtrA